jgi:diacylglycerol O-acyltransferase / wax synthase
VSTTAPEPLSFDDAQILQLESDAIKGHTGKLLVLAPEDEETALDAEALRARAAERIGAIPMLSRRVIEDDGRPCWTGADVDLEWHIADASSEGPLDEEGFRRVAGEILAERLDHERPLWRVDVVPLQGGRTGLVGRIHHAMADGVTAIRLVSELLFDLPEDGRGPGAESRPAAKAAASSEKTPLAAEHHERPLLVRLPGALRRELRPGADTPLDKHIGSEREVAWTAFPLSRLKAIGHSAGDGATVNDVVLAVVAGGLRSWLEGAETRPAKLKAQIPVCMHLRDGDASVGNRDSFLNVDLPLDEPDPLVRLRTINAETSERKLEHDADTLYSFFHALGRFRPLYDGVTRIVSGPREFALSVSNVPGPRDPAAVCGREVREFCSFAEPADRHALRVAVISLGGDLAFGLCSDPNAIGELNRLAEALEESVAELEEALG